MADDLVTALSQALRDGTVLGDQRTRDFHSADALSPSRAFYTPGSSWGTPSLVVVPGSTEEVARTVAVASQHRTPIVPYGGGTGVMGAAVPGQGAVVVDLSRLNRIRSISVEDRVAWVEAGVVLKDLDAALNERGLMLGHDPYSTPIATVGGAISTNGVGYRAARYGSMGAQVLGLEVVLPIGEVLVTKAVPKDASGPNLNALFIGAEGTMGIITAAALRVFRTPEERRFTTISFSSFDDGFRAVSEMFSLGLRPALTDLTEEPTRQSKELRVLLYLVFEGYREEVEAQQRRALSICGDAGGVGIGPGETETYWRERHRSGERYKQDVMPLPPAERWSRGWGSDGNWDYLHVALPVSRVLEFRRSATAIAQENGVSIREYAIWTEPELFSMIMAGIATSTPLENDGQKDSFAQTVDQVLRLAQDMGGTMEYCHGVGLKLGYLVEREWGSGLEVARRLKRAMDPNGIMNPGKLGL